MATDPLSEAREALRELLSAGRWTDREGANAHLARLERAERRAHDVLARLDALPAPERWVRDVDFKGPVQEGWFYPDAPSDGDDA